MSEDVKQEIMESERRIKTYISDMLQQQQPQAPSATQRKLNLDSIPALSSPATAAKKVTSHSNTSLLQTPLPPINNSSATDDILDKEHPFTMSEKARESLRKGMAKPPYFDGSMDEKSESIVTWWRQMSNYARTFDREEQAMVIKTYLRGSAALWLDSRERELDKELSLVELADGLTLEYGSETTSTAALQKLEALTMASEGCQTIHSYNATFSRWYNLCSTKDQTYAAHCYMKGIHPKYLKYINYTDLNLNSLAEAKAAVTLAVVKHDTIELSYNSYNRQKVKSTVQINQTKKYQGNQRRRWEKDSTFKVNLSNINQALETNSAAVEDDAELGENEDREEGQIAVVSNRGASAGSKAYSGSKSKGVKLTQEQLKMLMAENRCFNCHKVGHKKPDCKSPAATQVPKPLKE
jgi:hypothetical protein